MPNQSLQQRSLSLLLAICLLMLLAACGGRITETTPPAALTDVTMASVNWVRCAAEGGTCAVPDTTSVRYGSAENFATKTLSGTVSCSNATFGDPYPGVDKYCDYNSTTTSTTPAPTPTPAPAILGWTQCAIEGGTCSFTGTQQIRYGLNGQYAIRTGTTSSACNNQVFGDPIPGVDKFCEVSSAVGTAPTQLAAPAPTNQLPSDSIFSPASFWYQPIPENAPLHFNSANFVKEILRQKSTFYGTVTIATIDYSSAVYVADAGTPTTQVGYYDCTNAGYVPAELMTQWAAVPIPAFAQQAGGTDGEMTVYQPSTKTIWEFWQSSKTNGQWRACWGGKMNDVSRSNGVWTFPFGTTATGLPFMGGQITAEELKRGEIRHVIGISLVELEKASVVSWPANRSDGYNPNNVPNRIPEGARFRLDPAINVDALNLHPVAKIIAKAAQKYGFVVWDAAGALSIRAQNAKSYTALGQPDPYLSLFNGAQNYAILDNFPWDRMQFMPLDYGKP